jgi:hypothetical protein
LPGRIISPKIDKNSPEASYASIFKTSSKSVTAKDIKIIISSSEKE